MPTLEMIELYPSPYSERLRWVLGVNVIGPFLCAREALKRMSTRHGGGGGAIVNVSSGAARLGSPNEFVDYAASKGALDTFTLGLAREVANEGVRVNAVRAGLVVTDIHASTGEPGRPERIAPTIPMQRAAAPVPGHRVAGGHRGGERHGEQQNEDRVRQSRMQGDRARRRDVDHLVDGRHEHPRDVLGRVAAGALDHGRPDVPLDGLGGGDRAVGRRLVGGRRVDADTRVQVLAELMRRHAPVDQAIPPPLVRPLFLEQDGHLLLGCVKVLLHRFDPRQPAAQFDRNRILEYKRRTCLACLVIAPREP